MFSYVCIPIKNIVRDIVLATNTLLGFFCGGGGGGGSLMHFCPRTMTTHAESINSDLQRELDRRLRHIQH